MSEHQFEATEWLKTAEAACEMSDSARFGRLGAIADVDRTRAWNYDGYTSTTAFLMHRAGMGAGEANREVFLARSLGSMPEATRLTGEGRLYVNQLEALAHAHARHPDQYGLDETVLVESIAGLTSSETRRVVEYWCQAHDTAPDGTDNPEPSRLFSSKTWGGRGRWDGDFDPVTHDLVDTALDTLIAEMVRHTPRNELGSRPEMRAEALGEMARRFLDSPATPTDHGNRPHPHRGRRLEGTHRAHP